MTNHSKASKLSHEKTAHLFPAFVPEYLGIETAVIESTGTDFHSYLENASCITGNNLSAFDILKYNFLDNRLKSQYITYIISCCISDILHAHRQISSFVASYSMGIYAALYHCRSIDFGTGLKLIKYAFEIIEDNLPDGAFSMCAIGGLGRQDIITLTKPFKENVFIINQNSEFSFLLSGRHTALESILKEATATGAMQTRMLPVAHPYHTRFMKKAAQEFEKKIKELKIAGCGLTYVSSINQQIISTEKEVASELVNNLQQSFDWYKTFSFMLKNGITSFIECGAGESLYRMGKFIEGDFKIYSLKKFRQLW
ncbi:MAG: hypothetical protein M0R16_08180 [Bacteroidales bacterium]|jgi:[acyl-carrier-protein] S-malonyltransferase|nr:hypothetical protein [Bacteroidales bacterium]